MITRRVSGIMLATALAFSLAACAPDEEAEIDVVEPEVEAPVETDPTDIDPDAPETSETSETPETSEGGEAMEPDGEASSPIELVETSYDISLADMTGDEEPLTVAVSSPGTYTFVVTNDSSIVHALEIEGNGVEAETGDIAPGATATLEVELPAAGEYDMYCPIGNHKELGMDGSFQVGG